MSDERREFPRIVSLNLVSARPIDDTEGAELMGRTRNLSQGGILLEVTRPYPILSVLELQIALGERIIRPVGRVVRLQELENGKIEMGIKFTEISESEHQAIVEHIESL